MSRLFDYKHMNVSELTKQLIARQSYCDGKLFEKPMTDFLVDYVKRELPWFEVVVQEVAPNRSNLFLRDSSKTKVLVIDHVDTVTPSKGWRTDPLKAVEEEGRLFGLGASDSKGNVAALLVALKELGPTKGLAMLFYVDEEYYFAGMDAFIASDLVKTISPECILSVDGNASELGIGCRGNVEFDLEIRAESGHSANPQTYGALIPFMNTVGVFGQWLKQFSNTKQGSPTYQVARLRSGLLCDQKDQGPVLGDAANRIPDYLDAKVEVRTTPGLDWDRIHAFWQMQLNGYQGLSFCISPVLYDEGFLTSVSSVRPVARAVSDVLGNVSYLDMSVFGYLDIAKLRAVYSDATLCSFGIGEPGVNHKANEFVRIDRLNKGVEIYKRILTNLLMEKDNANSFPDTR